jgi:hypothetical protein
VSKFKTNRRKLLLFIFVLLLLSQTPFAYRRYKLGRLHAAIQQLNSQRVETPDDPLYKEFVGVIHVHSFLGGHSNGNFDEIIAAALSNHLDFVVMTEHPSAAYDTAAMTLKGMHGSTLFVNGNEVSTADGDRLLLIPGDEKAANDSRSSTQEVLARRTSGVALAAYPDDFKNWGANGYDGIEIYNVYTNARKINPVVMFFDGLWSYRAYPDLLFANFYQRPASSLKRWDELTGQGKRLVATAGNDAHANVGLSLNDSTGKTLIGFKLDPYERSFRLVRLHVLAEDLSRLNGQLAFAPLNEESLISAIKAGHCFVGFDFFGDTRGFSFTAEDGDEHRIMGDEIKLESQVKLKVAVPAPARILLLKNGTVITDENVAGARDYMVSERGVYRVEVYPSQLPAPVKDQPWIISNPIYVR